jgi:Domain of unknown function (DUF4388)
MSRKGAHRVIIPTDLAIPAAPVLESPGGALADAFPISGQIDPKAFPFLVVQLHRRGATGSLKVEGPSYHKALYFRSGRVLFGSSNDPRDQLGSILIESGKITPEQLADVNAKVGPGNPLAKVLADTGFVSQRELSEAARAKVERILSDVLTYTVGKFDFEDGVLPKGAVDLKLATERLVMTSVRRVSDRNFVLRHIDGLDAILGPTSEMVPRLSWGEIESEAGGLPQHLDGRRTLKEAAASARLEEFEAAKIACGLLFLGLVERVRAAVTASSAPAVSFADVEAGNELDLGATAAQAFASAPAMVVPTVEPEPAAPPIVAPPDDDEPPPFVMGDAPAPPIESSEIAFGFVTSEPEPAPAPVVTPTPAYDEPPVIEAPSAPAESPSIAMAARTAAPEAAPPPDEPPPPMVTSSASPLPLVMPDKSRPGRARASTAPPPPREAITPLSSRSSRPSKEDLAALDDLLNARTAEGPLTPLEKPGGFAERPVPQYARSGGGRRQTSGRGPFLLGLAAVLLGLAAGGWFYFKGMPGRPGLFARASPVPGAVTSPLPPTPTTTLAAADVVPSPMPAAPSAAPSTAAATSRPAPPTVAPATAPPPVVSTPRPSPSAAAPDGRALLRAGRFPEAARAFVSSTRAAGKNAAVIQLLIACSSETVQKAVDSGSASDLVILPVDFKGRDCYRLVWGVYPSATRATAALSTVPEYFRNGGAAPKVLGVSEVVP